MREYDLYPINSLLYMTNFISTEIFSFSNELLFETEWSEVMLI